VAFGHNSRGKKARPGTSVSPNINVTPLVDVVLVLLIIFMVIIPNMQEGKTIEMIKVEIADAFKEEETPITVTISVGDVYTVDEQDMSYAQAVQSLRRAYADNPKTKVLLRGDARLPYSTVRSMFHEAREIGFVNVALAVGVSREWSEGGS
jgi:biopolymer transport protein ExbD